ncbi:TM1266 family iron-only hydrogenase system putative regulator [Mesoaciditoga sp.]
MGKQLGEKRRLGVVAIMVGDRNSAYFHVNQILHEFGEIVVGRLGVPYRERNISIMALLVDGNTDEIGALTGKLGRIKSVNVKSAFIKIQ